MKKYKIIITIIIVNRVKNYIYLYLNKNILL